VHHDTSLPAHVVPSLLIRDHVLPRLEIHLRCIWYASTWMRARVSRHARANSDANALMRLTPACGAHHHAARDMSRVTFVLASHRVIVTARACSESSLPALCRSSGACKPRSKRETDAPALALACAPAPQTDASRDRAMKRVRKDWHGMQEPVSLRDWSCVNDGEGREACTNLVTCMHVTCIATIVHTNNSCTKHMHSNHCTH